MVLVTQKVKTPPVHHRKRHGQHHKRNDQYHKTYWPYLPLLGIAGVALLLNLLWAPLSHQVLSYAVNTSSAGLLAETNAQRSNNSEPNLQSNAQLTAAAQAKANDMATRNYWSHNTPDGIPPWQFATNTGYTYQAIGENLAYGFDNSSSTVLGWMNSTGHRANILNVAFQEVGFGIANAADYQGTGPQTIVVALYGKPLYSSQPIAAPVTAASIPPIAPPTPGKSSTPTSPISAPPTTIPPAIAPTAPTPVTSASQPATVASTNTSAVQSATSTQSGQGAATREEQAARPISRIELFAGNALPGVLPLLVVVSVAATGLFIFRHLRFLHKAVAHSETFIVRHPTLDVIIVSVAAAGVLLSRTAGFIY